MELFGTDGVRGIPGRFPLTPGFIARLGAAAARELTRAGPRGPVLVARDTRGSGPALARALARGFARAGCGPVVDLGVLPTPGLARLAVVRKAAFGVVVSASHNPPEFNGIKFFDGQGGKLSVETERRIEQTAARGPGPREGAAEPGTPPGGSRIRTDSGAAQDYLDFLVSTFPPDLDLAGMRILADAAHGAAYRLIGPLLRRLGAEVRLRGDRPNGRNINAGCGALEPEALGRAVRAARADCGLALDGDADRVVFADETGREVGGDVLIAMAAAHLLADGLLGVPKVAVTVMSNAGLEEYLRGRGIATVRVPVGDRSVSAAMEAEGLALGGEESGHIIFSRFSRAGDGMLTALQILALLRESGRPLSWFRRSVPAYPQVLRNLPVRRKVKLEAVPALRAAVAHGRRALAGGRVFLRYSGTEPLLRILVEGPRAAAVRRVARRIEAVCRKELNDHAD